MITVKFYDEVDDALLKFAVIVARYNKKFIYCKHINRNTYEIPGGRREDDEKIFDTAKRELWEETGAIDYKLKAICPYSVIRSDKENVSSESESFGMLYYADIKAFEKLPGYEIEKIEFFNNLPKELTYPDIQPKLFKKVVEILKN